MIDTRNVYHMLALDSELLKIEGYSRFSSEDLGSTADLLASILVSGIRKQLLIGLDKGYVAKTDSDFTIRGSLDVSETTRNKIMRNSRVVCNFEEFSVDVLTNRVIKKALSLILPRVESVRIRADVMNCMIQLADVSDLGADKIDWSQIRFHRNNRMYPLLMNICRLILECDKESALYQFTDDQVLKRLYSKFMHGWINQHWQQEVSEGYTTVTSLGLNVDFRGDLIQGVEYLRTVAGKFLIVGYCWLSDEQSARYSSVTRAMQEFRSKVAEISHAGTDSCDAILFYAQSSYIDPDRIEELRIEKCRIKSQLLNMRSGWTRITGNINRRIDRYISAG